MNRLANVVGSGWADAIEAVVADGRISEEFGLEIACIAADLTKKYAEELGIDDELFAFAIESYEELERGEGSGLGADLVDLIEALQRQAAEAKEVPA